MKVTTIDGRIYLELTPHQNLRAIALGEAHQAWYRQCGDVNARREAGDILAIIVEAGLIEQEAKWSTTLREIEAGMHPYRVVEAA